VRPTNEREGVLARAPMDRFCTFKKQKRELAKRKRRATTTLSGKTAESLGEDNIN